MDSIKKLICHCLIASLVFSTGIIRAESVEDKFTQIAPNHAPGGGEFVHGSGYGKLLMRIMIFGSVPTQGIHYMPEGTDILFAMLYAGGYNETTKMNGIKIRRKGTRELVTVDLENIIEEGDKVPKVMDGDVITVPYNWRKDIGTIGIFTGFIGAMTGFTLSIIALSK